jgi:MFS family permease
MTVFDLFVVNVAIPALQQDLAASVADIGMVIAGYELTFGCLLMTGSRLGDIFQRRTMFALGMLAFGAASLLCGLAPTTSVLIAGRLLQGAAAALLFPQIYALLKVLYEETARRRAFALLGMTLGLAAIAGQVLGGFLVEGNFYGLGWRIVFLINLPISLVCAFLCRYIPPENRADHSSSLINLDLIGVAFITMALFLVLMPLLESHTLSDPAVMLAYMVGAVVSLALYLAHEKRQKRRNLLVAIDLSLLTNTNFALGILVVLIIYSTASSFFLCFALLMQTGHGFSPLISGSLMAPASVGFVLASLIAPKMFHHFGIRSVAFGALAYAGGFAGLALLVTGAKFAGTPHPLHPLTPDDPGMLALMLPIQFLLGFGQGLSMTPLLNIVIGFVNTTRHTGMASGMIATMQQVGGAFGIAVTGIIFNAGAFDTAQNAAQRAGFYNSAFSHVMIYTIAAALCAGIILIWLDRRSIKTQLAENPAR